MAISPEATRAARAITRRLAWERAMRDLSQHDVARSVGASQGSVSAIERGVRTPHLDTAIAMSWALDLDLALAAEHHLPLLALTSDEVDALTAAAAGWAEIAEHPALRSALDKLTAADGEAAA